MRSELLERRQQMMKLRATGLSLNLVVKDLAAQYNVTRRAVYYDWRNRKHWLKTILELKDPETFFLDLVSRHREIYRLAVVEYLKGDNSNAKIGALRLLREINRDLSEMVVIQDVVTRVKVLESKTAGIV